MIASTESPQMADVAELGERLAELRLCDAAALEAMRRSLERHGQLTPIVAFADGDHLEMLDGFKRLRAARALGWSTVAITIADVPDGVAAKVRLAELHQRRGLTELEEAWLIRSLYRDDKLSQPEIARHLARHKSWVCRRLMLVESLDSVVQADVRVGLLAPRAAIALAALPRGNQAAASKVVIRHGLTVRQTDQLVAALCQLSDDDARATWLVQRLEAPTSASTQAPTSRSRSDADWLMIDIATLLRAGARLQARLLGAPLDALATPASSLVLDGLGTLSPVLAALARTIATMLDHERAA